MDKRTAERLVAEERARVEAALRNLNADLAEEFDTHDPAEDAESSDLTTEMTDEALIGDLRDRLAAVERAEHRLAAGTYGKSVQSGEAIPDGRLEADPLAERTVEEERRREAAR
jgi:DnaK suppressor protein